MATKPKASPHGAKLKKFLADPNKRATLPTKLLSPAQRKAREQNTRLNAPVVPGSSLTNRALKQETNAAVTEKYAPAEAALNSQLGQAKSFQAAQPTYYDRYQAELRAAASAQRAAGQQLQSELGNIFGGAASANQGAMDSANSQAQASAAQRGATVDPGVAQRGAQAAGVGNNLNASFAALAASQGAAQQGGLANQAEVVAPLAKFAAGVQAQKGTQSVLDQLSALGQQKGAFATDYKGQRLTDEQKNLIANQALGLNKATKLDPKTGQPYTYEASRASTKSAASTAKANRQAAADRAAADRTSREKIAATKGAKKVKPSSGLGSISSQAEIKGVQRVKSAAAAARQAMSTKGANSGQVRAGLANGYQDGTKYTADEINAAFDLLPATLGGNDGLSAANVKALHKMGIHVNGNFKIAKPSAAKPSTPTLSPGTNLSTGIV